jgi:hypothetical protein
MIAAIAFSPDQQYISRFAANRAVFTHPFKRSPDTPPHSSRPNLKVREELTVSHRERKSEMLMGRITKHKAGELVTGGIYLNRKSWELAAIGDEGGRLPAEDGAMHYYKLPLLLVMALAPFAGLAFVLFLVVAVPIMFVYSAPRAIGAAFHRVRRSPQPDADRWEGARR